MSEITDVETFKRTIDSLPINQQRQIASQFIAGILDLTDDQRLIHAQTVAADPNATEDDYIGPYKYSKHAAVENIQFEWDELDQTKQVNYYVAKACAVCLAPSDFSGRGHHLAWNVAHHCNCARMCATMGEGEAHLDLAATEKLLKQQREAQFQAVKDFLDQH
jgi:hypothetical protein